MSEQWNPELHQRWERCLRHQLTETERMYLTSRTQSTRVKYEEALSAFTDFVIGGQMPQVPLPDQWAKASLESTNATDR